MPRSVNHVASKAKRTRILKLTKGYFGARKNVWTVAKNTWEKGLTYAYRDRRNKKRNFRSLWIQRINAAARLENMSYSTLMGALHKAGIEINGTFSTAQLIVTVEAEATTINISGTGTLTAGQSTTLTATVENGSGDTLWGCEETSWRTTGTQVTFTANEPGTYHIHAANNGADSVFVLTVSAAATPEPTAVPTPMPEPTSADSTPQ